MKYWAAFFIYFVFSILENTAFAESPPSPGKVLFAELKRLPDHWWKNLGSEWTVWDENSYYLWGANTGNYKKNDPNKKLRGSGLASSKGPTRGRGHSHYIGVITTSLAFKKNDKVFELLQQKLQEGGTIVVPILKGRYGLGTNSAFRRHKKIKHWYLSQKYLFEKIIELSGQASEVVIPEGAFWPDCGLSWKSKSKVNFVILTVEDLPQILLYLDSKIDSSKTYY